MIKLRRTRSERLTQAATTLATLAWLAGAVAVGPAASAKPVAGQAAAAAKAVAAATPTWRRQAPPEPAGTTNQAFGAVSCSSSSACLAIAIDDDPRGFGWFAETWNGSHWTVRTVPDGTASADLAGVSCRGARSCVAVGSKAAGDGFVPVADRWNGSSWAGAVLPAPAGATTSGLAAVACSGHAACTAIGSSAKGTRAPSLLADRWNGSSWKIQPVPEPTAGGGSLAAVSCPAADACRAVGSDSKGLLSELWNGSSWRVRGVPAPAGGSFAGLNGVSCTAAASCEAVGTYSKKGTFHPLAEVWNGSRWRAQALPAISGVRSASLDAVSCVAATDCEAAGQAQTTAGTRIGVLEKWNGTRWSVQKKVLPAGDTSARLNGISCSTSLVCEAVGYHEKTVPDSHLLALRYSAFARRPAT